jgi:hypothetical protein
MRFIVILLLLCSCNTVHKSITVDSIKGDSTNTNSQQVVRHYIDSNVAIQRDNGNYSRTIIYPPANNPQQGIVITETGNYNRDKTIIKYQNRYTDLNVYHHIDVTRTQTIIVTKKDITHFAWLPFLLLAIGGIAIFLATRFPWYINIIIAFVQKFIKPKNKKI